MIDASSPTALEASLAAAFEAEVSFAVVACAVELDVFTHLVSPTTAASLAERLAVSVDGMGRLLAALTALGLTGRDAQGSFVAVPAARALLARGGSAFDTTRFRGSVLAPLIARLAPAVRDGAPQHRGWTFADAERLAPHPYDELAKHPDVYESFLGAMDADARGVGTALADALELAPGALVVDAGCGGGVVARELLQRVPGLVVHSFDLAPAVAIAAKRSATLGLQHEVSIGDVRAPWPVEGADVALLSAVLTDFDTATQSEILRRARASVRPGGRIVVSEQLLDDSGTGPGATPLLSLVLLAGTAGGRQLRRADLATLLEKAGLRLERVGRAGPRDFCVATPT